MKKTILFSDVHLKVHDAARTHCADFVHFLRSISPDEYDRLICLGDLFDFWFEYKHVVFSGYFDVLRAFADLRDAGIELHLICGNHDFWAGRFLRDELGFHVYRDTVTLPFGDKKAFFVHGDGVNPKDRAYRLYKRFARNPWIIRTFRLLHPDAAMALAQRVSHGSRTLQQVENPEKGPEAKALCAYAQHILQAGKADAVFCGHAHAPCYRSWPTPNGRGIYINTGDWMGRRSHAVWDGETFHLFAQEQEIHEEKIS